MSAIGLDSHGDDTPPEVPAYEHVQDRDAEAGAYDPPGAGLCVECGERAFPGGRRCRYHQNVKDGFG